ncbi:MAG: TonB-dependent receptor [Acidobacteriaceae bacterium]|jgi:Carboxypeptidase regulatory-like domain
MTPNIDSCAKWKSASGWLAVIALLATVLGPAMAGAQTLYGTLTGTVNDNSGAVVPNVTVTLTSQTTGAVRTVNTSATGEYRFGDVLPGTYSVSTPRTGSFGAVTQNGIVVQVNREVRVDLTLQPASVSQTVTVTTAPPMLQTETADVNHEITETQLEQLPLTSSQGRNFQALYSIIPGAAAVKEQNSSAANPSRAMSLNVNGMSYNGNTTRIDGAMNYYGWLPYLIAYVPPAESIASVNIDTNSFNAEQGLAGGAVINVTTKSGTSQFHGTAWEYYQDAALNARPYTSTALAVPTIPKNVFNQFGFNIGGPVYIPKILTGRKKLFFFDNFERTTRRQLITSSPQTVPDAAMLTGDFSEVSSLFPLLYDPQPGGVGPYLPPAARPTFLSEYGCNCIPASRQSAAAATMIANLQPIAQSIAVTPTLLANQMASDYIARGTLAYNRNTNDAKITWIPTEKTQVMGKYSIEPFSILDPQSFGNAGGGAIDGGQPGASQGRIQNVGMGMSHAFNATLLVDADFGYTRQVSGAQSVLDVKLGDYGTNVLGIPGTNGVGTNYVGQPEFAFGTVTAGASSNGFSTIGNASAANPFLFRDNQFTGDVNLSWTKGRHATKYGFTYYHFDLNHFQPTSGSYINSVRGGFAFQGGMTVGTNAGGTVNSINNYNMLADYLLGLPNQFGAGPAVAKALQIANPNALRWTELSGYAQDQWTATSKLTVNYGVRYEIYPPPYRDHTGIYILDPNLPQTTNVEIGGVNGEPENSGLSTGYGFFAPRLGLAYRLDEKTVVRAGAGLTSDPDSFRFMRDTYPMDVLSNYTSASADTIAVDSTGAPITLTTGIPAVPTPNLSSGFIGLPTAASTTTVKKDFHRGYIESWNFFVQRELPAKFVANVGYVGTHDVRQFTQTGYLNAGPLPSGSTPCMANGYFNPSTGLTGPCNFQANTIINEKWCTGATTAAGTTCYNTGGIGTVEPLFSASYNGLQSQLTYSGGASKQLGVVYTYSHAIDFEDNGAGSGSGGLSWNYPAYYSRNRADAGFDQTHNLEIWGIYHLPFGKGQLWANGGVAGAILGGWQFNGQFSHISGSPFNVSANSNTTNAPGEPLYANLVKPYHELGGHARSAVTNVSGGKLWFDPTSFGNPTQPTYTATEAPGTIQSPVFGNTNRNEFRGPGVSVANASVFRSFPVYRESQFEIRFEAFNITNHPLLYNNPGTTVGSSTLGEITSFGPAYSPTQGSRSLQFSGRFQF